MILWIAAALAIPPHGSLPECTPDSAGPTQTLLSRVRGLRFDADGNLWVADAGSLTVRDAATLAVLRTPAPGVDRWRIRGEQAISASGVVVETGGIVDLVDPRPATPTAFPLYATVTARAEDPTTGRRAYATPDALVVVDRDGHSLASLPIQRWVESTGFHSRRVYTVSNGALVLWNADGRPAKQASNWWASATLQGTEFLGTDRLGHLLRGMYGEQGLCVVDDCAPIDVAIWRPPAPGPDVSAYGASVATWSTAAPAPLSRPTRIVANERAIVVAVLEPELHYRHGVAAVQRLVVLDAGGRKIRRSIDVQPPSLAPLELHGDVVQLADRAWSVRSGKPTHARSSEGPSVRVQPGPDGTVGVRIGTVEDGVFRGVPLPPRLGYQLRGPLETRVHDDYVAVAGTTRLGNPAVEVWCVPSRPSSTSSAGWLTAPVSDGDWETLRTTWSERPAQPTFSGGVGAPYVGELPGDRVLVLESVDVPTVPSVPDEWRVVVRSPQQPPTVLPPEVVWQRALVGSDRARWVVHGVVVWEGAVELTPTTFELGPPVEPTAAGESLWRRQLARTRRTPEPELDAALASALFDPPAEAGDNARRVLANGGEHPVLLRVALHDQPLPDVTWERPPTTERFIVWVGVDPSRPPWELADQTGLSVAWIDTGRTNWTRPPHPTTPWGRSAALGALQEGSLLVVDDGRVVWTGADRKALDGWLFK